MSVDRIAKCKPRPSSSSRRRGEPEARTKPRMEPDLWSGTTQASMAPAPRPEHVKAPSHPPAGEPCSHPFYQASSNPAGRVRDIPRGGDSRLSLPHDL